MTGSRLRIARALVACALMIAMGPLAWASEHGTGDADDVATLVGWYDLQLAMIRETPGFSPPVAARSLAYVGIAGWEALAPTLPDGRSLAGQLRTLEGLPAPPPEGVHGPTAVGHAVAATLRGLFPTALASHLAEIDAREAALSHAHAQQSGEASAERSRAFGRAVADAILTWAATDGGHEAYLTGFAGYAPTADPGAWVPTPRRNGPPFPPLLPTWGDNRPLALATADACPAPAPPAYSEDPSSALHREATEVYDTVRSLTEDQRTIAKFWSDDPGQTATPAGHWAAILGGVLREKGPSFSVAVEAYARLGIAVNDAFIACWTTKYRYDLLRPITYIQRVIDPAWNRDAITDPVITPPFPEYTSGHSVVSSAAATVLTAVLGPLAFLDRTHQDRGLAPRAYASFEAAADEAAISRLYGGIHFRSAIEEGVAQGACVGRRVAALTFRGPSD